MVTSQVGSTKSPGEPLETAEVKFLQAECCSRHPTKCRNSEGNTET